MIINIYTIFDDKAKIYNKPFYMHNDAVALRALTDLADDPNTDVHKHPEDFVLFKLGTFDDVSGKFDLIEKEVMLRASEIDVADVDYVK